MRGLLKGIGVVLGLATAVDAAAVQEGRIIEARPGDTVIAREGVRMQVVRRRTGRVRIAVNQARAFVVVMFDHGADGTADWIYRLELDQPYPLEAPWEGPAELDEYWAPGRNSGGIAVVTPQGVIQFLSGPPGPENPHEVANALAVVRTLGMRGGIASDTFAALEPYWLEGREHEYRRGGAPGYTASLSMKAGADAGTPTRGVVRAGPIAPPGGAAPEDDRDVTEPRRIHRVEAIQPEAARAANVSGVVIIDLIVTAEGTVKEPRINRSIPLLDDAALEAIRQWRYEPARREGRPIERAFTDGVYVGPAPAPGQPKP